MDRRGFNPDAPGRLARITHPCDDCAFIPDRLPPRWEFPNSLWPLLAEAREALALLEGTASKLPNPDLLLRRLGEREAIHSSSLEGTYATPEELALFELSPSAPESARDKRNDWREVLNYAIALKEGYEYLRDGAGGPSLSLIRQLHHWLLSGVRGSDKSPGGFRKLQNHIGHDRRFIPAPPEFLLDCLDGLESALRDLRDWPFDPLVSCYLVHYQFEAIHPFLDGNGRVGRLLLALMTWIHNKIMTRPWLYMSAFFERYKDEYVELMFNVSATGGWTRWIEYCLRGTVSQANDATRRCSAINDLQKEMYERVKGMGSSRLHGIIDLLFDHQIITGPLVQAHFSVTPPTAKSDILRLVEGGILIRLERRKKPYVFYSPALMRVTHEPGDA